MSIRARLSLFTSALIAAVVLALALTVLAAERSALEAESQRRLQAMTDGVSRLAQESLEGRDQFMLLSYLMHLRKEHEELAFAEVTARGHTSRLGERRGGQVEWTAKVLPRHPVTYTVSAVSGAPAAEAISVSTAGVALRVDENARVTVRDEGASEPLELTLGFDRVRLDADIARALTPLARRTAGIAGAFLLLGWAGAFAAAKALTSPLAALASAAGAIGNGNLDVIVAVSGKDEVAQLASRFNDMTAHLRENTRFREDLLHTLTHELNTPLAGLKGYLELWQAGRPPREGVARDEVLRMMSAAVLRMEHSLGNALRLFRKGADDASSPAVVWVDELAREACLLFSAEAKAKAIALVPPHESSKAVLYADPETLRHALVNLVSNAVKYTPAGGRVTVALEQDRDTVRVSVADTGRGIAPEDLAHLFEKFYRGDDAGRRRVPGTGLGLSIARKAARALGGDVEVRSRLGEGSVFTVVLPRGARAEAAA